MGIPKTHMLQSLVNAELPQRHVSALNEFIDNAFGEAAGNARHVEIYWDTKQVVIWDDGRGVQDINALFTIGDSHSRLSDRDIGNFGYGAKVGALYLGWEVTVVTTYRGHMYEHTVDWEDVLDSGIWPDDHDGTWSKPGAFVGTSIVIERRHPHRTWRADALITKLAHTYRPALLNGRQITLNHNGSQWRGTDYVGRLKLENELDDESVADGKRFSLHAGAAKGLGVQLNGIHIAYGYRFITTLTRLETRHVPAGLYAEVTLTEDWKRSLTVTKNDFTEEPVALLRELERMLTPLLDTLDAEIREIKIHGQTMMLSKLITNTFTLLRKRTGRAGKRPEPRIRDDEPGGILTPRHPKPPEVDMDGDNAEESTEERAYGIEVVREREMGTRVTKVSVTDLSVRVSFNQELPYIESNWDDTPTIAALAFNALLDECLEDQRLGERLLPALYQQLQEGSKPVEVKQRTLHALLKDNPQLARHAR